MRWIKFAALVLMLAVLSGCSLALPEDAVPSQDAFVGFWVIYDSWENEDAHKFDLEDDDEQYFLAYEGKDASGPYNTSKTGTAFGDVHRDEKTTDDGEGHILSGTMYLIQGEWSELPPQEVWLEEGDVIQSLKLALEPEPEKEDGAPEMEDTDAIMAYTSQDQIDAHGAELIKIAKDAGYNLTLATESPRLLRFAPVYQRPNGSFYAGEFDQTVGGAVGDYGYSRSQIQTETLNGKSRKETTTVSVTVKSTEPLLSVRLIEMSATDERIASTPISRTEVELRLENDEPYEPSAACAYVIVEETYVDGGVKRSVYDRPKEGGDGSESWHILRYPREDGLAEGGTLNIQFR